MAQDDEGLAAIFQNFASALSNHLNKQLAVQNQQLADLDRQVSQIVTAARDRKNKDDIDGLQGQIDQLDDVLNGLTGEFSQISEDVAQLKTKQSASDGRIDRRATLHQLTVLGSSVDEVRTNTAGLPHQIHELSRITRELQETASKMRNGVVYDHLSSDVVLPNLPSEVTLFEDAREAQSIRLSTEQCMSPPAPPAGVSKAIASTTRTTVLEWPMVEITNKPQKPIGAAKNIMRNHRKRTPARSQLVSNFVTPSQLRQSLDPDSDSTMMPDVATRITNKTPCQTERTALSFASSLADRKVPSSSMIADSDGEDEVLDEDAMDERVQLHISNRRSSTEVDHTEEGHRTTPDGSLTQKDTEDEQEIVDNRPITFLDRELHGNQWLALNKPCPLPEFIHQERARVKVFEDTPHTQRDVPRVNYKLKGPPKQPSKRSSRAKRSVDLDEIDADLSIKKVAKKDKHDANSLLKSFQSPPKQAWGTSSKHDEYIVYDT